jgi:hypothetical protein
VTAPEPIRVTMAWFDKDRCCIGSEQHVFMPAGGAEYFQQRQEFIGAHVTGDTCPQCGEADLVPEGAKHRCPVCRFLQPCCNP